MNRLQKRGQRLGRWPKINPYDGDQILGVEPITPALIEQETPAWVCGPVSQEYWKTLCELRRLTARHSISGPCAMASSGSLNNDKSWTKDVEAVTEKQVAELGTWRGYGTEGARSVVKAGLIGKHNGAWAFPVYDSSGTFRGVHELVSRENKAWVYDPKGIGAWPMIHGKLTGAQLAFSIESSWDWLTFLLVTGAVNNPAHPVICTRGATNVGKLSKLLPRAINIIAIPQNDDPAKKWLAAHAKLDIQTLRVVNIPEAIHDLNDWLRADLTPARLREAIEHAAIIDREEATTETPETSEEERANEKERLALALEAKAAEVAETFSAYYDQHKKEYVVQIADAVYQTRTETQFKRELRFRNLSNDFIPLRNWSQIDLALRALQEKRFVSYVGALAGKLCGYYFENGIPLLITSQANGIEPVKGQWEMLEKFFGNLLGGPDETYNRDQLAAFYGWLKVSYSAYRARRFQPGQALALAGPVDSGKSLAQALITEILGGRCAKAALFLQGRTDFNGELFEAEHLMMEDEAASTLHKDRLALGTSIKNIIANRIHPCHAKHRQIVNLAPWWRITISLNDRPERLLVLPPMSDDIADKIILLRASRYPMPMLAETAEDKERFWRTLSNELPAFLYWLTHECEIAAHWRDTRFGVKTFHHPQLLTELEELSPAIALLGLIDTANIWEVQSDVWEGTALALRAELLQHPRTARDAGRLLEWTNACGQYLNDLAQIRPLRVKQFRTHTARVYEIYRPS